MRIRKEPAIVARQLENDLSVVKSLQRAFDVIEALAPHPGGVSVTEVGLKLGIPKSSAFRVLNTLRGRGYVRQDPETDRYALGSRFLYLARWIEQGQDLRTVAQPHLKQLRDRTGETAHLAIPEGTCMVYIEKIESMHSVRMASQVGQQAQFHCTSLGKAYLSALPEPDLARLLAQLTFERRTPRTITSPERLRQELRASARRGFSIDDIENEEGVRCTGAPIMDSRGLPAAAISVSAPSSRFTKGQARETGPLCAETAAAISEGLGNFIPSS